MRRPLPRLGTGPAVKRDPLVRQPARCDAEARRGTGTGACDSPLDARGQCERAGRHL